MKDQPTAGAAVQAKRRPGLSEPWRRAVYVGPGRLVRFDGDREAVEAHKIRLPKERKAKVHRQVSAPRMGRAPIEIEAPDAEGPGPDSAEAAHLPVIDPETPAVFSLAAQPRPVPKPRGRLRSGAYLDHVRALPCCSCGAPGPSDPHHWSHSRRRGVGTKLDDYLTAPLCRRCHDEYHRRGALSGRTKAESVLCLLDAQVGCLVDWIAKAEVNDAGR